MPLLNRDCNQTGRMTFDLNSLRIEVKGRVTKGRVATRSNFMKVAGDQICLNLL